MAFYILFKQELQEKNKNSTSFPINQLLLVHFFIYSLQTRISLPTEIINKVSHYQYPQSSIQIIKTMKQLMFLFIALAQLTLACNPCYSQTFNQQCARNQRGLPYTLHVSVHPHLDAYWIFDFETYYNPKSDSIATEYFHSNRFSSAKEIFSSAKEVLWGSKEVRQSENNSTQKAHRSFFNSEIGFFKRWYSEQSQSEQYKIKQLLKTKYWQILGGGYVEHDEGCAYYDDIIENFQMGLHFLKEEFNYFPKIAISADSFGHSQTTLAILSHLGIEGYFVQRSDEHILLQNKTEFIWKAQSANGKFYGALPTHIRWAIHSYEDQFNHARSHKQNLCQTKQAQMITLRSQNEFLKRLLKSKHIMRYFGHDFQKFDQYSYSVIQNMMETYSMEKCNRVIAVYGNPTEYFITLMGQVFGENAKPILTRNEDIFPIWDYDSGLYWTGYYSTDAYHKKDFRDLGRFLQGVRKIFLTSYVKQPSNSKSIQSYKLLEEMAEQLSYLQHHDGISGTSKYKVLDQLESTNNKMREKVVENIVNQIFLNQFPTDTDKSIFTCTLGQICKIPQGRRDSIYLKIINTDSSPSTDPIILEMAVWNYYLPDCEHEVNCFCYSQAVCPCRLYLYPPLSTFTSVLLKRVKSYKENVYNLAEMKEDDEYSYSKAHFHIKYQHKSYAIGYKRVQAKGTERHYDFLSRIGEQSSTYKTIRSGKYALGNDPTTAQDFSHIKTVSQLQSKYYTFFLIQWQRYKMTTLISIPNSRKNQWKVETVTATEAYYLQDLYFEVISKVKNDNKYVTDSNGWLTVTRQLFKHQDYKAYFSKKKLDDINGNTYPATSFAYIEDQKDKVSINLDRPQGVIAYHPGALWINFDRLSGDDGKWVEESAYRSQYQKYTHIITVQNKDYNERKIQRRYDQALFIQGNQVRKHAKIDEIKQKCNQEEQWRKISNIDSIKFTVRPFNDSTTILRIHNLNDQQSITVGLYASKVSPLLTAFYGRTVSFSKISQGSLGGNMQYSDFLSKKWNWKDVIDLSQENNIFQKTLKENITLRPLQLRTFILQELRLAESCMDISRLEYNKEEVPYSFNNKKAQPKRQSFVKEMEKEAIKYLLGGDHCNDISPIVKMKNNQIEKAKQVDNNQPVQLNKEIPTSMMQSDSKDIYKNQIVQLDQVTPTLIQSDSKNIDKNQPAQLDKQTPTSMQSDSKDINKDQPAELNKQKPTLIKNDQKDNIQKTNEDISNNAKQTSLVVSTPSVITQQIKESVNPSFEINPKSISVPSPQEISLQKLNIMYTEIENKIQGRRPIISSQKQIYFKRRLKQFRATQAYQK